MGRLNSNDIANAVANYNGTAAATPAYEASTPAQTTDYSSYQDNSNPYSAGNDTTTGQDNLLEASAESVKEPEQPEQPAPQTEAQRTEAAAQQNANLHAAVPTDEYLSNSGITANQWQSMTAVLNSPNAQSFINEMNSSPEGKAILNAYNSYYATPQQTTAPAVQQPQAPAQQAPAQQAPAQNPILPSAGGNYQADDIYDPSKTYGRQADGSYVYSSSAAQLQRDLNRVMNAGLTVDGLFGAKTQEALNSYLAQYGSKAGNTATGPNADVPVSQAGSMSAALAQSSAEAPKTSTPAEKTDVGSKYTKSSGHDDAWYADQYEKLTGKAPRTDILSPERIRSFVDEELNKQKNQPTDIDEAAKQAWEERQNREQEQRDEIDARRDEAFTPKFINDLKNGKSVEQIIGEGDLSYNRWIQDNWDDLSYTYNLGEQSPFESSDSTGAPVYGEPRNGSVPERYAQETLPGGAPVYGSPRYGGVPERATWDNYNDVAMNQQLAELEREWNANNAREENGEVYGSPRNGSVPERYMPEAERQSMAGNSMSAALEGKQPLGPINEDEYYKQLHDLFQLGTPEGDFDAKEFRSRYEPIYGTGGIRKDGVRFGLALSNWDSPKSTEGNPMFERDYYRHLSPKDIYDWQQRTDEANLKYGHEPYGAYKRAQEYERWLADRGLTQSDEEYAYDLKRRHGEYSPEDLNHDTSAYYDMNRPEVHYGDTRSTTLEDAGQLALYDELENLYRNSVADPRSQASVDEMPVDDIQSSGTESSEEQEMRSAYEAAMQNANRARDIFAGLPTNDTEAIQQTRQQWTQNMQNALEQQLGPYMQQFQQDFAQLKQQFPNYSDTALMDMVLVNEEMRNGQSSYYKWLANSLG